MINKTLWDLINTGEVVSFIDDIIVGMVEKEGYNKVVEEIVKRLVENDFYVKPEKYKWNVREVGFWEVVIGLKEIKMKEKKMKTVLDWLTPNRVKDIQRFLRLANYYR